MTLKTAYEVQLEFDLITTELEPPFRVDHNAPA